MEKLKVIVLYTKGHLGSSIILNQMTQMSCFDIQAIVRSESMVSWEGFKRSMKAVKNWLVI